MPTDAEEHHLKTSHFVSVEKDGILRKASLEEFEKMTSAQFSSSLEFEPQSLKRKIAKKIEKLYRQGNLTRQQLWFGSYYQKELNSIFIPDVTIRYIDPVLGWGVFANRDFRKMEFIAEYTGVLRKHRRRDRKNAYCFEYTLASGVKTPYTIDAQEKGSIGRYLNHSKKANVLSALATREFINHLILIAAEPIRKGDQLCYDYGSDYWSAREEPITI